MPSSVCWSVIRPARFFSRSIFLSISSHLLHIGDRIRARDHGPLPLLRIRRRTEFVSLIVIVGSLNRSLLGRRLGHQSQRALSCFIQILYGSVDRVFRIQHGVCSTMSMPCPRSDLIEEHRPLPSRRAGGLHDLIFNVLVDHRSTPLSREITGTRWVEFRNTVNRGSPATRPKMFVGTEPSCWLLGCQLI
jgi:hypothetical protein